MRRLARYKFIKKMMRKADHLILDRLKDGLGTLPTTSTSALDRYRCLVGILIGAYQAAQVGLQSRDQKTCAIDSVDQIFKRRLASYSLQFRQLTVDDDESVDRWIAECCQLSCNYQFSLATGLAALVSLQKDLLAIQPYLQRGDVQLVLQCLWRRKNTGWFPPPLPDHIDTKLSCLRSLLRCGLAVDAIGFSFNRHILIEVLVALDALIMELNQEIKLYADLQRLIKEEVPKIFRGQSADHWMPNICLELDKAIALALAADMKQTEADLDAVYGDVHEEYSEDDADSCNYGCYEDPDDKYS